MSRAPSPSSRPPGPRLARPAAVAAAIGAVVLAALATGCSLGGDEPATVTLPELNTTTTTRPEAPSEPSAGPEREPLPVAWIVQVGGPDEDRLLALSGADAAVVAVGDTTRTTAPPPGGTGGTSGAEALVATIATSGELDSLTASGSAGDDTARGVAADGTVLTCGATTGDLGATSGGQLDAWCAPLEPDGQLGAASQFGGADAEVITGLGSLDGIGTWYASGTLSGILPGAQDTTGRGLGNGDALMMQLDVQGRPVWARQFGTATEDGALGAAATPDGDGVLAGYTDGDLEGPSKGGRDGFISRFDPSGNQRWITQLGSSGADTFTAVTTAGEAQRGTELVIAAGITDADVDAEGPALNAGLNDGFVAAVGPDGELDWLTQFGSSFEETVAGVASDGTTVYVTGSTGDDFGDLLDDGGPGGARDGFLAAIDTLSGEVLWVSRFGSAADETMTGLAITEDGLLVASGITTGQMGDDPPGGGSDGFVIAFPLAQAGGGAASSV